MPTTFSTEGLRIADGQAATFAVAFYSDAPTDGPWTIRASLGNPTLAGAPDDRLAHENPATVDVAIDNPTGQNGDTARITVSVLNSGPAFHGELLTITSSLNGVSHYAPVWISAE
jgi:hypothetical protein